MAAPPAPSAGPDSDEPPAAVFFDAWLRPARSMNAFGAVMVLGLVSVVSLGLATAFVVIGAWPVAGFFGLDVLALALGFLVHGRAQQVAERITLTTRRLLVSRHLPGRSRLDWGFEPTWLRVTVGADREQRGGLVLSSHGQHLAVGTFLSEEECRGVAASLREALAVWREPGRNPERFRPPAQEAGG